MHHGDCKAISQKSSFAAFRPRSSVDRAFACGVRPRKTELAHRVAYVHYVGDIPEGLVVMHSCDNTLCCNPNHLRAGTIAENNLDAIQKGRNAKGEKNGRSKLSAHQVGEMRELHSTGTYSYKELATKYGITAEHASAVVKGEYWDLPLAG